MVIIGMFLYGIIFGFANHGTRRKRTQHDEHAARLMNAVMQEEREKKRLAEAGTPSQKSKARDFKQTRR